MSPKGANVNYSGSPVIRCLLDGEAYDYERIGCVFYLYIPFIFPHDFSSTLDGSQPTS